MATKMDVVRALENYLGGNKQPLTDILVLAASTPAPDSLSQKTLASLVGVDYGAAGDTLIQVSAPNFIVRGALCTSNSGQGNAVAYLCSGPNGAGKIIKLNNSPSGRFYLDLLGTQDYTGAQGPVGTKTALSGPLYINVATPDGLPSRGNVYVVGMDLTGT